MHKLLANKILHELFAVLAGIGVIAILFFLFSLIYTPKEKVAEGLNFATENSPDRGVIHNYSEGFISELALMSSLQREDQITLFGSSEFNNGDLVTYNFLPNKMGIPALGFGQAFHQNFSIYCELLAGNEHLENSKIVLFLSPGWFETDGTNSEAFTNFVKPNFLDKIWSDRSISLDSKVEIGRYIEENSANFNSLSLCMQSYVDLYLAEETLSPNKKLKQKLLKTFPELKHDIGIQYFTNEVNDSIVYKTTSDFENKDSITQSFLLKCKNNNMFVDSSYYVQYVLQEDGSEKNGSINSVDLNSSREYKDLLLVLDLLQKRKANVSIVIQGLNPYYYANLTEMDPLIDAISDELKKRNIPYLNLFTSDQKTYQPGTLSDIMHLGNLGWLRVNEFIYNNYKK